MSCLTLGLTSCPTLGLIHLPDFARAQSLSRRLKEFAAGAVNAFTQWCIHKKQLARKSQFLRPVHKIRGSSNGMLTDRASIYFQKIEGQLYLHGPEAAADLKKLLHVGDLVVFFKNYVLDINLF